MSITAKRPTPPSPQSTPTEIGTARPARDPWILRAFDAVYRFLASLKLAVISLATLSAVLAYATFFEARHGTGAVQQQIYQSPLFALLLAILGINILCAALIRFPWTKRQTGFVITHGGLIVVLIGSFVSLQVTFDGQLGMVEGEESAQIVRIDHPALRVQPIDAETGAPKTEFQIPFYAGAFAWEGKRRETLMTSKDPFELVVTDYVPASSPVFYSPVAGPDGTPMIKAGLYITPPNSEESVDIFAQADRNGRDEVRWFKAQHPRYLRAARDLGTVLFSFQYADRPELIEDFLDLPEDPLTQDRIRIHYKDQEGKARVFVWPEQAADAQSPKPAGESADHDHADHDHAGETAEETTSEPPITLPDSDITMTLAGRTTVAISRLLDPTGEMTAALGEPRLSFVEFQVQQGDGPQEKYLAAAGLPSLPNNPSADEPAVRIHYYHPPEISQETMQGRSSTVEVLGTPDGRLYYRALSREGLRGKGPLEEGKRTILVQKSLTQPVTFSFEVQEYLTSGVDRDMVEPVHLPVGQKDKGIPAARVEMTVDGETKEFWLRQSNDLSPKFQAVGFEDAIYRVSYDFDRKDLPFRLKLVDFEVGMDPGTNQPSSYQSDVLLTDPEENVQERPISISMNEPLVWKKYTFYQSNYVPMNDGKFMSIFQVRYDPVWGITYSGCLLVCLGIFVQFYMRAGVFTDGGKKQREREARRAAKKAGKGVAPAAPPAVATQEEDPFEAL